MTAAVLIFGILCALAGLGGGWFLNEWVRAIDRQTGRLRAAARPVCEDPRCSAAPQRGRDGAAPLPGWSPSIPASVGAASPPSRSAAVASGQRAARPVSRRYRRGRVPL
jgi:hypothetical protein